MNAPDVNSLRMAATERRLAVAALQKKYEESDDVSTEQLVRDMRELLATERVVLDASSRCSSSSATTATVEPGTPLPLWPPPPPRPRPSSPAAASRPAPWPGPAKRP